MNKRYSMLFTIAAVAIVSATLFGSTYTQTQIGGTTLEASSTKDDLMQKIHDMGGLELVMPQAFAETDCGALENSGRMVHDFQLTGESVDLPILGHTADSPKTYSAMTFSQQIPGPTVRVTQGDIIKMTLTIPSDEVTAHGNDMHASQMSSGNFGKVLPGTSKTYCYIAESAGVFKYHCSGVDLLGMDQHVLSGMYGIAIVDPANGYKKLMVEKTSGSGELDQHVRIFVENHGNEPLFFHIVGEILDRVTQGNRVQSGATETWLLGGSQNMIVDLVFDEPGTYAAVNHDYAAIYTGAVTVFVAGDPFDLNPRLVAAGVIPSPVPSYAYALGNPSDAVPPMGKNSIAHPAVNVHGMYTDERASEIEAQGAIPLWDVVPTLPPI